MSPGRVVVDGSNIATEGRSLPSLVQLDEAVRAYREEHPDDEIIVVVDATFAHRIPQVERDMFEEAAAHNELVYPPAGAVGRGDAFLLRIAERTDAVVLSNDSFQEFHGEHEWLFDKGRLVGGTPVPGVGWIFVDRTPVRGPKSREAVKEAKKGKPRIGSKEASQPMPVPKKPPPRKKETLEEPAMRAAIEAATEEAVDPEADDAKAGRRRRRRRKPASAPAAHTVNTPLTFIQFVAEYQPGAMVEGEIESFASHGAFVMVGDTRCYVPLSAMGDPPPRSARETLQKGDRRVFVVQALDAPRRGVELAIPGFEHIAGRPTDETVEAEIEEAPPPSAAVAEKQAPEPPKRSWRARRKAATEVEEAAPEPAPPAAAQDEPPPARRRAREPEATAAADAAAPPPARKRVTKKGAAPEPAPAEDGTAEARPRRRAAKKPAPDRIEPEAAVTPAPAPDKTAGRKSAIRKAAAAKAPADSPLAARTAAGGKKAGSGQTPEAAAKKAAAKKAPTKAAPKKVAAKKVTAKKVTAKKVVPKKVAAKKVAPKKVAPENVAANKLATGRIVAKKGAVAKKGPAATRAAAKKVPGNEARAAGEGSVAET